MKSDNNARIFHGYYDAKTRAYQRYERAQGWTTKTERRHTVTQERSLSYQFYPHYHPYVGELVKALIEKSVRGLQSVDTEYTTIASLSNQSAVTLSDGTVINLPANEKVHLQEGAVITLADGTSVRLAINKLVNEADGATINLPKNSLVTISQHTYAKRLDGTPITFDTDINASLPDGKPRPRLFDEIFSAEKYNPSELVTLPYPVKDLDFASTGAYSVYNWELFYHVPITIAIHLSKNQRFAEAQQWFHFVFDPTDDSDGPTPERFWKVKPFQTTDVKMIEDILVNLSTGADTDLFKQTLNSISAWKNAPFRPHVVARYRQSPYMFKSVMAYLDNLIAWGDSLFRQDTRETINDASQLYVLAANILGPRPQEVPKKGSVRPQTYANLRADLDDFGNVLRNLETDIPFDIAPHPDEVGNHDELSTLRSLGKALYFCVPRNDKLLEYWTTVADRLFKIHNSLNLQGIFRQLALFDPPIDPAMLARGAASGLDVNAIVNGINQPLPLVRFQFLLQKSTEICQEVKSLGGQLLSAMEKKDNEALAILRAQHESVILKLTESVRYGQWQESIKAREGLEKSLNNTVQRYTYYERLLGVKDTDIKIPELDTFDNAAFEKMKLKLKEPELQPRNIDIDIAKGTEEVAEGKQISSYEKKELEKMGDAQTAQDVAVVLDTIASIIRLLPEFGIKFLPFGGGGDATIGGEAFAEILRTGASISRGVAGRFSYEASQAAKIGGYARREQEWAYQSNLAAGEITQMFKQLRGAQIREAITEREWKNHQQQIEHAEQIEEFLTDERNGKKTNQAFYTWMKREVKGLYGQCFQFAFDVAKKAERALQHELGNRELSYLQYGYLSGKEGLLAGEKLFMDLKRMDMAYHELNQREYELEKHISLISIDPHALLKLRMTGRCTFTLPEILFDMDGPGHYFRRIKSAAISIPCVTGPYTSVNCTLTLLKSSIRKNALDSGDGYARSDGDDSRFDDHFSSLQSVVTSSGQNDSGLFEANLNDSRYLPFENHGVLSEWQLELPADPTKNDPQQFDYDTISDVILHTRYTAREGGSQLRTAANTNLKTRIEEASSIGSVRLISVRHEFPMEWSRFKNIQIAGALTHAELSINLEEKHYPYWSYGNLEKITYMQFLARADNDLELCDTDDGAGNKDPLLIGSDMGDLRIGHLDNINLPAAPIGKFTIYIDDNTLDDLWLAITWGKDI